MRDEDGVELGIVENAYPTGAYDVVEIIRADGTLILAPVVEAILKSVDFEKQEMVTRDLAVYAIRADGSGL